MTALLPKLIFLVIAAALIREAFRFSKRVSRSGRSRAWPFVEGRVERSEAILETGAYRQSRPRSGVYVPVVEYVYEVRGREYRGDEITFGRERLYTSWPQRARQKCGEYPLGKQVRVFYDPTEPAVSCLERGKGVLLFGYSLAVLFVILAMLAVAGAIVY